MAYKITGQMCAATITDNGAQDGSPATGVTATDIKAFLRSVMVEDGTDVADVSALGDTAKKTQVLRTNGSIKIESFVPDAGEQFAALLGHYIDVKYKPIASLSSFVTYSGVVTGRTLSMPDGAQIETVTITVGAN